MSIRNVAALAPSSHSSPQNVKKKILLKGFSKCYINSELNADNYSLVLLNN